MARKPVIPRIPKWYTIACPGERAFVESIRDQHLVRDLLFSPVNMLVYADWLQEHDDPRSEAWRLLGTGKVWPISNEQNNRFQWHESRHLLKASWEIDADVFACMKFCGATIQHGLDSTHRFYPFVEFASCFKALCAFVYCYQLNAVYKQNFTLNADEKKYADPAAL